MRPFSLTAKQAGSYHAPMRTILFLLAALVASSAFGQLASPEREQRYRALFPKVDDPAVQAILDDPRLVLFGGPEMPRAYQDWEGALKGIHSAFNNVSADPGEQAKGDGGGGNGNVEFPWNTGGMDRTDNGGSYFAFLLPEQDGRAMPIVWWRDRIGGYAWRFPVGTVFLEILWVKFPSGRGVCFELRTRTRDADGWEPDLFRPFPTLADYEAGLQAAGLDSKPSGRAVVVSMRDPHPVESFRQTAIVHYLTAPGDEQQTLALMRSVPFKSCKGKVWVRNASYGGAAPTTKDRVGIIPRNYEGPFLPVTRESCRRCHQQVNKHVDNFDARRDWYGRVRGGDEIFSFHPFAASSISDNGASRPVALRASLVNAGLLERWNPQRHQIADYPPIRR